MSGHVAGGIPEVASIRDGVAVRGVKAFAGLAAVAVGAVAWASRSTGARKALESMSHGAAPGRIGSWLNSRGGGPSYRAFAARLDLGPEDELLDVACGWGEFLVNHAAEASRIAGVDLAPAKVELARQRLADRIENGTAEVVVADAARLPWPDNTFTAVTCMDAFPFFPDPEAVLAEFLRVLRPGGRALVSFGAERMPAGVDSRQARGIAGTYTAISEAAARRMTESSGFDPVTVSWAPISGGSVVRAAYHLLGADEIDVVVGRKPGVVDESPE